MYVDTGRVKFWVTGINLYQTFPPACFCFPTNISTKKSWEKKNLKLHKLNKMSEIYSNCIFVQILCLYPTRDYKCFLFIGWLSSGDSIQFVRFFSVYCRIMWYWINKDFIFNLYVHVFTCHVYEECCQHMHGKDLGFSWGYTCTCLYCLLSFRFLFFFGGGGRVGGYNEVLLRYHGCKCSCCVITHILECDAIYF